MEDTIVRDITINADLERVWELVSRPGWWVPTEVEEPVDYTPGHQTVRKSTEHGSFPVEVVRVDPRTYAAFRWASTSPGAELAPGRTTLVEFEVTPVPDGVRVTVTESGFAALDVTDDVKEQGLRGNTEGWQSQLVALKGWAEPA
jgi:uncharacterized protein YndB with AHSA1/START domain